MVKTAGGLRVVPVAASPRPSTFCIAEEGLCVAGDVKPADEGAVVSATDIGGGGDTVDADVDDSMIKFTTDAADTSPAALELLG